jgi:hypothetical protein
MKKANGILLVGGGIIGFVLGYFRHLLTLPITNTLTSDILIHRALISSLLLIPAIVFIVIGAKQVKNNRVKKTQ